MKINAAGRKVKKVLRIDYDLFMKLEKYADGVDFPSENSFFNHLLKLGIEAAEEIDIDKQLEADYELTEADIEADIEVPYIPNKDIKAPKFDTVTEGYNPNDKKMPSAASYMKDLKF